MFSAVADMFAEHSVGKRCATLKVFRLIADMNAEHDKRKALRNTFFHYQLSIINYGVAESRYENTY